MGDTTECGILKGESLTRRGSRQKEFIILKRKSVLREVGE